MRLALAVTPLLALCCLTAVSAAQQTPASPTDPREWTVPYGAETRPRDPYADAQGRVWFVGQNGNYIAYLDSRTNQFQRYEIDPAHIRTISSSRKGWSGSPAIGTIASSGSIRRRESSRRT